MKISLDIKKIVIVTNGRSGPDHISIICNKPGSCWPYRADALSLELTCASGGGHEYVVKHILTDIDDLPLGFIETISIPS